ncbi:hypothetical protein [Clostridium culturomicium]|uniref:hypothetical protein n=1 Tax=Clostridium culturomicium TaxID=1499683 RepID=UPI00058E9FC6|nr:hypothetical protein [Clostridium culturomicium]
MGVGVFAKIANRATKEEFEKALMVATENIKSNNIMLNKRTKVQELKILLDRSLSLVKGVQAYDEGLNS